MSFTIGSLFDGSGGFPLAAFMCGGEPLWASEIEPFPIAVTKTRFPYMKHLGSVTDTKGNEVEPVDVITFGSPCQDLSVAGKRAGLKHEDNGDDETTRSGLFMEAVRIIREMREATNGVYPRFALWENVPGAFSSNKGEDFRIVLEELIKIVEPSAVMPPVPKNGWPYADHYCGDGWSIAYRVLDAQHCGVPQRRKRIYLILDLGGQCAGEISFKREGLRGYFEKGRSPWQSLTGDAENCAGAADREGKCVAFHLLQDPVPNSVVSPCMGQGNSEEGQASIGVAYSFDSLASNSMKSSNPYSGCRQVEVAKCLDTTDPNPSKNQGGIAIVEQIIDTNILDDQGGSQISVRTDGKSPTLRAEMHGNVPCVMGFDMYNQQCTGEVSRTIKTPVGGDDLPVVVYNGENITHPLNRTNPQPGDPCHTLGTDNRNYLVYCLQGNGIDRADTAGCNGKGVKEDICYTLNTIDRPAVAYAMQGFGDYKESDVGSGLKARDYKDATDLVVNPPVVLDRAFYNQGVNAQYDPQLYEDGTCPTLVAKGPAAVCTQYIVRRLTPTECARLQGFPDKWAHPDHKDDFTDEEYEFWLNVRNTQAEINGKTVKPYTKDQMLKWYNKLHTDSAEYKLWGNGIALPCALYFMQGIAEVFA